MEYIEKMKKVDPMFGDLTPEKLRAASKMVNLMDESQLDDVRE